MHLLQIQQLAVWERPGSGVPLLFIHATGFHARVWDRIIEQLPGRHCFAMDLRGHGRSAKNFASWEWRRFGEDTAMVARELGLRGAVGVGHSIGGYAVALAAAIEPEAFSRLLLIDPVVQSAERYHDAPFDVSFIRRRRARWKSAEEMYERFSQRLPFSAWNQDVLRDYCEFGLLPDGDEFVLACPPEIEASIYPYTNAPETNISAELARIRPAATVMRSARLARDGSLDLSASYTDPLLASRIPNARDMQIQECSHFIPMERPDLIVRELASND
ncbi:MAG TPA: alpha/beta hydrolase [Bryobacteraceae bacterium]|nr:alpha/beta hydrolase [Bryobacteraceae bacterium]